MAVAEKPLYYLSIHEAQQLIKDRKLSPVDLTKAVLERIARRRWQAARLYQFDGGKRAARSAARPRRKLPKAIGAGRCTAFPSP